ncbi:MAG: hypothetical protein M3Y56_05990 [Armatimonadota bacterium]|nr:hypothetical protein [Armatimonadota bacterium]
MNAAPVKLEREECEALPRSGVVNGRAGTLVGSRDGGEVRVWSAHPRVFWLRMVFLCGVIGLLGFSLLTMAVPFHGFEVFIIALCGYAAFLLAGEVRALQEIQVIVTDKTGITLSTWQGARTVPWAAIQSVEESPWHTGAGYLWIEADGPFHIDWAGYTPAARRKLSALIEHKRAEHPPLAPIR